MYPVRHLDLIHVNNKYECLLTNLQITELQDLKYKLYKECFASLRLFKNT